MKPFHFQKFTVNQSENVFRVGTDAVLLGACCSAENSKRILEIGCGTGIISLMVAQRNPKANILAIDINKDAVKLAGENFKNSIFKERLKAISEDFKNFTAEQKFDFIVCNPPYFEENTSQKDVLARQNIELNFKELILNSKKNLSENGMFSVIIPFGSETGFVEFCAENQLFLNRKVNIKGIKNSKTKRVVLEFTFYEKDFQEEGFVIEESPRKYSEQYIELTKDFHIFQKNNFT